MAAPQPLPPPRQQQSAPPPPQTGPPPGSGPGGPFASPPPAPAGMLPHHPHTHHAPGAAAAVAAHFQVALGMRLDAYAPALDGAYRQPDAAMHDLSAQAQEIDRFHPQQAVRQRRTAAPSHPPGGGQFGILAPTSVPVVAPHPPSDGVFGAATASATQQQQQLSGHDTSEKASGQLSTKIVVDPPDLEAWRDKLFNVDETIVLTEEQFNAYFPHVDNVYSHRSTQRYKRKPFLSHYWDCRMKGRPPGTPKSEDPNKKKRKRNARERDLCDVKIKITEYLPGAQLQLDDVPGGGSSLPPGALVQQGVFVPGVLAVGQQRIWTIQRVNGNGGNGKGDGVAGPHKHTLAKSDEIKKNSVQRFLARQEKEEKRSQKHVIRKATGTALATAKKHTKDSDLKLYAACFCPFSQRVWIALEAKHLAYQYCETDPYRRPAPPQLLEANPRGCVPAIRHGDWACAESSVILEYLEDLDQHKEPEQRVLLYPSNPQQKASCRLWIDHINSQLVPAFYALVEAQDLATQREPLINLQNAVKSLVHAAVEQGPFFLGETLSLVDVHFAPFALRFSRILAPHRGWSAPAEGTRLAGWLEALEGDPHVRATVSGDEFYTETVDMLARYCMRRAGHR